MKYKLDSNPSAILFFNSLRIVNYTHKKNQTGVISINENWTSKMIENLLECYYRKDIELRIKYIAKRKGSASNKDLESEIESLFSSYLQNLKKGLENLKSNMIQYKVQDSELDNYKELFSNGITFKGLKRIAINALENIIGDKNDIINEIKLKSSYKKLYQYAGINKEFINRNCDTIYSDLIEKKIICKTSSKEFRKFLSGKPLDGIIEFENQKALGTLLGMLKEKHLFIENNIDWVYISLSTEFKKTKMCEIPYKNLKTIINKKDHINTRNILNKIFIK